MKRWLRRCCYLFLIATLMLWLWLFVQHLVPALLLLPASVLFLGLSLYRLVTLPTPGERLFELLATGRLVGALLLLVLTRSFLSFAFSLLDLSAHPSVLDSIRAGLLTVADWLPALSTALLALGRLMQIALERDRFRR